MVEYETRDHIALITLNRPDARNAVNGEVARALESALDQYEGDDTLWAAILAAAGTVFCAGADLKEIAAGNRATLSTERGGFAGIVKRARTKPLIAAVNGAAVAGGCEIALACDLIVASENAIFGLPEVKRSLIAAAGGLFRLPRAIGRAVAMEMILTGDPIDAERAYALGLVNTVTAAEALMDEAEALARRITANAPLAVQASRAMVERAFVDDDQTLWKLSAHEMARVRSTEDAEEGPRAFIEKRAPVWTGR